MVIINLAAINIFPTLINYPSVRKHARGVVVFDIGRDLPDVLTSPVTTVQHRHLRDPAVHVASGAAADKHDRVVRKPARLNIIVNPERELPQPTAVGLDFVQMKRGGSSLAVTEDDGLAIIMHCRVTKGPPVILYQNRGLAGAQIEFAQ